MHAAGFGSQGPSANAKTGPVYTTYREVGPTCPDACPLKARRICYAAEGRVKFLSQRAGQETFDVEAWLRMLPYGAAVRHMVSGDWFTDDGQRLDENYAKGAQRGHALRPDLEGFSYTHGWRDVAPAQLNAPGLVVSASTEGDEDTRLALSQGWDVAMIVAADHPKVREEDDFAVVVCPNQSHKGTTCDVCRLCAKGGRTFKGKPLVVGFRVHSASAKKVQEVLQ